MNQKKAKELRHAAGYRNQSRTPGTMPFPGVARLYSHPVVERRQTVKTSYVKLPMESKCTKVRTVVSSIVLDNRQQPVLKLVPNPGFKQPIKLKNERGEEYNGPIDHRQHIVATNLVPVSKMARLDPKEPKGMYRALKKLDRQGLLIGLGTVALQQLKEAA